jgi:anti-anti-sigma factor
VLGVSDHGEQADAAGEGDFVAASAWPDPGWTLVLAPAEVDIGNAGDLRADLVTAIGQGHSLVIADMSRTSFCDCAGVGAMLTAASQALRAGAEIRVVARAAPVLRTFELTGLHLALRVYATIAEALRGPPSRASAVLAFPPATARLRSRQPTDVG